MKASVVVVVWILLGAVDLFAQPAAGPSVGATVHRRVVADAPIVSPQVVGRGGTSGEQAKCEGRGRALLDGAEVHVALAPRTGRRDQPGLSFILRLDEGNTGTAYVLYHAERAYSELPYPVPREKPAWTPDESLRNRAPAPPAPRVTPVTTEGLSAQQYEFTTLDWRQDPTQYHLLLLPDTDLGAVAFHLESLVGGLAPPGGGHLRGSGAESGIVLSWDSTYSFLDNPPVKFSERLVAFERKAVPADMFVPPADYRKIPFSRMCFWVRDPRS